MKKIAVIPNPMRDIGFAETKKVIKYLSAFECCVYLENDYKTELEVICCNHIKNYEFMPRNELFSAADILVTLGGDGTIIEVAVDAAKYSLPIIGINVGTLGFLTQSEKGDYSLIRDVLNDNYSITECMMLDISILDENDDVKAKSLALNDLIVSGDEYKMIAVSVNINGTNMARYSSDGLIVSGAIGSTAYSLSAGGAVMHPEVDAMIITPICPHTLKARCTVIPGESVVEIFQEPPYRTEAIVRADGKIIYKFNSCKEKIRIKRSKYTTLLVKQENENFFDVLRNKLSD